MRSLLFVVLAVASCTAPAEPDENPRIVPEPTAECGPAARLVTDVCTELGGDDSCVDVDDVCVALCDGLTACTNVGTLRATNPWPVAPGGYCVECAD